MQTAILKNVFKNKLLNPTPLLCSAGHGRPAENKLSGRRPLRLTSCRYATFSGAGCAKRALKWKAAEGRFPSVDRKCVRSAMRRAHLFFQNRARPHETEERRHFIQKREALSSRRADLPLRARGPSREPVCRRSGAVHTGPLGEVGHFIGIPILQPAYFSGILILFKDLKPHTRNGLLLNYMRSCTHSST